MYTILVAEDTPIIREPLTRLLKNEGFHVLSAANGVEAMAAVKSRPVDLLLLDVMMPKMHGVAVVETLRNDPRWRDLPVIAVTGVMDSTWLARLRQLGVKAVMAKAQFTFESLLTEIRRHLAQAA